MAKQFTKLLAVLAMQISLVIPMGVKGQIRDTQTVFYGWETNDDATLWTISDAIEATQGEGNTGTYAGKINTNSTTVQFNEKVYVTSFSYAFKRTSNNNNYSVYIETSTDGQTWSIKDTQAMNTFTNGSYRTVTKEFDGTQELYVRFRCNNTTAIRYVDDVTITYASSASQLDPCDLTLTNASTSIVFDLYDNSDAYVINYTTSSTGEVTVEDSDYITTEVDQTNKTITVTPVAVTNGAKVITVNQAADDNYAAGSKTFTINITDSTPFAGGDVTFDATIDKGTSPLLKGGVSFACSNGVLNNGSEYRLYKNSVTTFSVSQGTITQIAFTGTSSNPASGFATQDGWTTDGDNGTWTGSAQEVSFTASSAQVRATVIVVTVDLNGVPAPSVTLTPRTDIYTPVSAYQIEYPYVSSGGYVDNVICNNFTPDQFSVVFCDADGQSIDTNPDWIITAEVAYFDNNWCLNLETALNESNARTTYLKVGAANGPIMIYSDLVTVTQEAAPVIYSTIPDLFTAATSTEASVLVTFNNWVVSGVSTNGKSVFVTDNEGHGFVIFSSSDMSNTYAVGSILSGTAVSCTLKLYNGFAELLNVNAADLTITTGGNVTPANVAMADLAGVNTGALVHYENLTCTVVSSGSSTKYYLTDGTTTLQVYNSLFNFGALTAGKSYNITGVYQQFNNIKEILPRSAADIEEIAVPYITLTQFSSSAPNSPYEIEFTYWSSGGLIDIVEYGNFPYALTAQDFFIQHCNAAGEPLGDIPGWYIGGTPTVVFDTDNLYLKVEVSQNESHETRTAYFKVCAYDANQNTVYSDLVTVNQAAAPTFAELPFAFNYGRDSIPGIDGLSQNGLGTDYNTNNTKLRFDGTGDWLLLQFDERPGTLTFDIKNNSFSGGTFKVQTSEDGVTYTDLKTYTEISGTQNEEFTDLGENVRYVKWIYTNKSSGNVGLGNIALAKPFTDPYIHIVPRLGDTVENPYWIERVYQASGGYLRGVEFGNFTISDANDFQILYCDENGQPIDGIPDDMISVISVDYHYSEYYEVYEYRLYVSVKVNHSFQDRYAYFKVWANNNGITVYSDLVTIHQVGAPQPYITLVNTSGVTDPYQIECNAGSHALNAAGVEYGGFEISGDNFFSIEYYDENGGTIPASPNWLTCEVVPAYDWWTYSPYVLYADIQENESESRTAFFKIKAQNGEASVYSDLITVTQAAPVIDYATLPFVWEGGPKADFLALNGVTAQGLGSDYASGNAPYLIKFDNTGDYIQVKCDQQPGKVTIGVKMLGGGNTSTITIQGSADGETFTDIEVLTISGIQGDELTLETTNHFAGTDRYVRLLFTKGSNVGVGPITIEKVMPYITLVNIDSDPEFNPYQLQYGPSSLGFNAAGVEYGGFEISGDEPFSIEYCDENGSPIPAMPDWLIFDVDPAYDWWTYSPYVLNGLLRQNENEGRYAYFKIKAQNGEDTVYSDLITVYQFGVYDLTVALADNVSAIYVFDTANQNNPLNEEGAAGIVRVAEGTGILVSPDVAEGYVLESLMINNENVISQLDETGAYTFTMPAENVTISATAVEYVPPTGDEYALYTGGLVEGDYLIVYDGGAMNTTVESDRLQFEVVTATNDVIVTDNAAIVWHIAPSGQYWTIYNADADAYAASTGVKNKAQMLADGTDDKALWTVSGTVTYEFVNKHNAANSVNANLRKNGTYGFACYATSTGGALSLYKKVTPVTQTLSLSEGENWVSFNIKTTLDDLKEALLNALGDDVTDIKITSQNNGYTYWDGSTWRGTLNPFEINQMYVIEVPGNCEISLSAMPINSTEHPITIVNGTNWIGFPFSASMSVTDAFLGFAVNGDKILAPDGSFATYNDGNWEGGLTELQHGHGYKYEVTTTGVRILVFPSSK